jgi:small subunit ribosomal protein S6
MPLYELFAVAKPRLPKAQLASILKAVGQTVMDSGGVVTDIKSYGDRRLAYDIRQPGERHSEVGSRANKHAPSPSACTHRRLHSPPLRPPPSQPLGPPWPPPAHLQAAMWQINFAASPKALPDLDHVLRVDERMLRWLVLKRRPYNALPTPYSVARAAEHVAQHVAQQQQPADA